MILAFICRRGWHPKPAPAVPLIKCFRLWRGFRMVRGRLFIRGELLIGF
jgi:hypothetical protein